MILIDSFLISLFTTIVKILFIKVEKIIAFLKIVNTMIFLALVEIAGCIKTQ